MPVHPFALFVEDQKGPLFREFCTTLEDARIKGHEMADREGFPFLIISLEQGKQVDRINPKGRASA